MEITQQNNDLQGEKMRLEQIKSDVVNKPQSDFFESSTVMFSIKPRAKKINSFITDDSL